MISRQITSEFTNRLHLKHHIILVMSRYNFVSFLSSHFSSQLITNLSFLFHLNVVTDSEFTIDSLKVINLSFLEPYKPENYEPNKSRIK